MDKLFTSGNQATNSDLAFWGDYAFVGYYTGGAGFPPGTGSRGGVRIFDISDPASPSLVRDFACDGAQNDPILWDRNGNGVPDLLLLAVDTTMAAPNCGAARVAGGTPTGWEGVRVFTMSDDPANPFQTITPVDMQYADCGAHTITAWTGFAENATNPRLIVYISSYPLGAGPTCGDTEFANTANPYDEDPPTGPLHSVIQVLEVPLNNPAATTRDRLAAAQLSGRSRRADGMGREGPLPRRSSRRRWPATTSRSTWSTTSPARRARSRARCGRSIRAPGSRTR